MTLRLGNGLSNALDVKNMDVLLMLRPNTTQDISLKIISLFYSLMKMVCVKYANHY